jgi:ADP-heptose:LPS heptosyltransferase
MSIPLHSKIRKKLNGLLNTTLVKLFKPKDDFSKIDPKEIKRILVIRINYRIGNILFMTPLIRALERKLPHAEVDMMVGAPFTVPLIEKIPNIKNVYPTPREFMKNPLKLYQHIKKINKNRYDLIICPIVGSFSTNMATLFIKSDIKLGFYAENIWVPINKTVKPPKNLTHEALKPLTLMDIFEGEKPSFNRYLDIALTKEEREEGKKLIESLISKKDDQKLIALFRDARGDKKIDKTWWIEFVKEMLKTEPNITFIDILPPNEKVPLLKEMPHISAKNLRDLAKIFSAFDIFICGDTGPMHLAGAVQTPTIALFNATDPSLYGPLGEKDISIDINNKDINKVTNEIYKHIKEKCL